MEDWSLHVINEYCQEHFAGDFVCEMADGKGRILIAKKAVPQGELLFSEAPLHIACEDVGNEAFLTVRRIVQENRGDVFDFEPLWYWCALSSLTAAQIGAGPKHGKLKPIREDQQKRLLCLYHKPVTEASTGVARILESLGLSTSPLVVEELLQTWILNCFEHSEDPLGYSAYFASSFVSHSCGANAIWTEGEDSAHILRAREDIAVGDEVTISYLEEQVLHHPAAARKRLLQETKLFTCGCERCAPPAEATGPAKLGRDTCRGFHCKSCERCGVFHRLDACKAADGLKGVACALCGVLVDAADALRLLKAEAALETRLNAVDEDLERKSILDAMTEVRAQDLLRRVAHGDSGPIGPQHWLCERLWTLLEQWYRARGRQPEQRRMLELRIAYQRKAYTGLSGALAWTLERQGDVLMRHLGLGAAKPSAGGPQDDALAAQVLPIYEESCHMLSLLFGKEHEYHATVARKRDRARTFLERRVKPRVEPPAP